VDPQSYRRKLTAILSADVAGYSRLMGEDEAATVDTVQAYKLVLGDLVRRHHGRVVDSPGDNLLAEFGSVVNAVQCAAAAQRDLRERNSALPENRRMHFRIGVNLGDVIEDESRIYGDGVNIAARLEALADPGGVCISRTAFDQVEGKLPLGYRYLGEQSVKNIVRPVGAYKVLLAPTEAAQGADRRLGRTLPVNRRVLLGLSVATVIVAATLSVWQFDFRSKDVERADPGKMAYALPEKPSIAVLPFANLSEAPQQEHFAEGVTEEIITTLSQVSGLFVVASNSVAAYKGKAAKAQQVSQEMSVRYVLEGSVRRSGERVRITAQLIDAITGRHLWADRYDRVLQDIFAVQDEISHQIVTALQVQLTEGEQVRLRRQTTANVAAWEQYCKGLEQSRLVTREGNAEARRRLESAVDLDPRFAAAWALLGHTYMLEAWLGWAPSPGPMLERAVALCRKAIDMDDSLGEAYMTLGAVHLLQRQHDHAVAASERAVALNPNSATIRAYLARTLTYSGNPGEAVDQVQRAMRLSPVYPSYFINFLGHACRAAGRYEEALTAYKRWMGPDSSERPASFHISLAITYGLLGREAEARSALSDALKREPTLTIERARAMFPYVDLTDLEREITVLRWLGLPEA
jgi:adenylate cyclase